MRHAFNLASAAVAVSLGVAGLSHGADAAVILSFAQNGSGAPITATNNLAQTTTTITTTNTAVTITGFAGGGTPIPAFFNLTANNSGAASSIGSNVTQSFSGSFSITSALGGLGINYLSGSFVDALFGSGSSLTMQASTPFETVNFTSSALSAGLLGTPRALALSFANVLPPASLCGTTICGFTSSVTGTFSANPVTVPEPASLALLGAGLLGLAGVRRARRIRAA